MSRISSTGTTPSNRQSFAGLSLQELRLAPTAQESADELADELQEAKQQIVDVETRMNKLRDESTSHHSMFKSVSKSSVKPSAAMLQVLESRARDNAAAHAAATAAQAKAIAEAELKGASPTQPQAGKAADARKLRMSFGLDAALAFESLTQVWATSGTTDDFFRPENNAAGIILPGDRECVADVLLKAEKQRVEALLKNYAGGERPEPTVPLSFRLGPESKRQSRSTLTARERRALTHEPRDTSPSQRSNFHFLPTILSTNIGVDGNRSTRSAPSSQHRLSRRRKSKRSKAMAPARV